MDRPVIDSKFESLRKCIQRIRSKFPITEQQLSADPDLQDILVINLERAVQICVDIASHIISEMEEGVPSQTMAGSFEFLENHQILSQATALRMQKAVGFRNVAVHAYEKINWSIVYQILTRHLTDFVQFAKEVDAWLSSGQE